MAITFVAIGSQVTGTGTSLAPTIPAGIAANDVLEIRLYKENTNAVTWPSGFTQVTSVTASDSSFVIYVARKATATGSESGAQTISWTGSVYGEAVINAYRGVDNATPDDATPTTVASGSLSNQATSPTITTASANAMVIAFGANFASGSTSWTAPGGMTQRTSTTFDIGVADAIQVSPGASGAKTFTLSGIGQAAGITVALKESTGAPASLQLNPRYLRRF